MKLEDMIIKDIGKTDYLQTIRLQKSLVEKRADGEIQDMILFSEHFPTIDFGSAVTHNTFSNLLLIEVRKKYENNLSLNITFPDFNYQHKKHDAAKSNKTYF